MTALFPDDENARVLLANADAWIAGTCASAKTLLAGNFAGSVSAEAFADPDALACGSGIPAGRGDRVGGSVRITGRWPNVSGCEDAAWAGLALIIDGAYSWAFIPVSELAVELTWQMAGMRGTGSHTLAAIPWQPTACWCPPAR